MSDTDGEHACHTGTEILKSVRVLSERDSGVEEASYGIKIW